MAKNSTILHFPNSTVKLVFKDFDDEINVDDLIKIDNSNIYAEKISVSQLYNKVGLMKAEQEYILKEKKLELEFKEADLKKNYRRQATENSGKYQVVGEEEKGWIKLTVDSLNETLLTDKGIQVLKKNIARQESLVNKLEVMYKAIKDKSQQLQNLLKPLTPEEFENEIIEGEINGILIKKKKHRLHD